MIASARKQEGSKLTELVFGRGAASSIARGASIFLGAIAVSTVLFSTEELAQAQVRRLNASETPQQPCVTLECIQSSDPSQIDWDSIFKGQPTQDLEVPRILHHVVLGEEAPPSMLKLVAWNFNHIGPSGYETKLWRDPDVEELIDAYGPKTREMWEHAKKVKGEGGGKARLKDIACLLILYAEGGIHFDADTVLCKDNLDYMVDAPGVVSFPFQLSNGNQVTPAAVSAPPGHRLMGAAMESFIALGPEVGTKPVLHSTGPHAFAGVVDEYFKEVGIDRLPIYQGHQVFPPGGPSGITPEKFWAAEIADLRFTGGLYHPETGIWHMGFGTWMHETAGVRRPCDEDLEMVFPWIDQFCASPSYDLGKGCFRQG